jgi:anthranilate synthase component 1
MVILTYFDKNNTIVSNLDVNTGLNPIAELFYGGAIGYMGFDGSCNQAIMIRSFLSKDNNLFYQAGAGVVASSIPENELQEVNNKLGALKSAIKYASTLNSNIS